MAAGDEAGDEEDEGATMPLCHFRATRRPLTALGAVIPEADADGVPIRRYRQGRRRQPTLRSAPPVVPSFAPGGTILRPPPPQCRRETKRLLDRAVSQPVVCDAPPATIEPGRRRRVVPTLCPVLLTEPRSLSPLAAADMSNTTQGPPPTTESTSTPQRATTSTQPPPASSSPPATTPPAPTTPSQPATTSSPTPQQPSTSAPQPTTSAASSSTSEPATQTSTPNQVVTVTPGTTATSVRTVTATSTQQSGASSTAPTGSTPTPIDPSSGGSGGLNQASKVAIGVVVPIAAIAILAIVGLIWWKKRRARQQAAEERRKEVEEYAYNPNADPTIPAVGLAPDNSYEMREDGTAGYRGWGSTPATGSTGRKTSTTMSGGVGGAFSDVASPARGNTSEARSGEPLIDGASSPEGEILGTMGPSAANNRNGDVRRGPSNASSSYSATGRSDGSDGGMYGNGGAYYDQYGQNAYAGDQRAQELPGQPVIRDNPARRNTRIENPAHYPQQSAGIAQNF
ncbi:Uncharacterized protein TCAP_02115 [Tolypocladium capitatum]|uniref:Serine-rich protein n=1 Tax=Tolypocladium capitatum TaxID=45235 RepID=A0A2K3QK98_9HYPO|nr:Uncharacterized protein TCAP_02115 [Tolypocladium capitatum]